MEWTPPPSPSQYCCRRNTSFQRISRSAPVTLAKGTYIDFMPRYEKACAHQLVGHKETLAHEGLRPFSSICGCGHFCPKQVAGRDVDEPKLRQQGLSGFPLLLDTRTCTTNWYGGCQPVTPSSLFFRTASPCPQQVHLLSSL